MRSNMKLSYGVLVVMGVGLIAACTVTVTTNDDGGATVGFTIGGATFSITLGGNGIFDVAADGPGVEKSFAVQLFSEAPEDEPLGATLILNAESVEFIPNDTSGKWQPTATAAGERDEGEDGTADLLVLIDVFIGDTGMENPCEDGVWVGTYEVMCFGNNVTYLNDSEMQIQDSLLESVRAGLFNLCLRVTGKQTGRVLIDGLQVRFDETDGDGNTNQNDNDNDNTSDNGNDDDDNDNADDSANDDTTNDNVNDNTSSDDVDDEDNEDPIDSRDPDGDGNFSADACDASTWVEITAENPPRYSGSAGNESCLAKIHFKNVGTGTIAIWWHVIKDNPSTDGVETDGWYSTGLDPGAEIDSVESAWINSVNETALDVGTSEVMVSRWGDEYAAGCLWISNAIHEDASAVGLAGIDVSDLDPCD